MLSVTNDLASRLHQAITPTSEQCYYIVYASLSHMHEFYTVFLQNILNSSSPRREPGKDKDALAVPRFTDLGVIYTDRSLWRPLTSLFVAVVFWGGIGQISTRCLKIQVIVQSWSDLPIIGQTK